MVPGTTLRSMIREAQRPRCGDNRTFLLTDEVCRQPCCTPNITVGVQRR